MSDSPLILASASPRRRELLAQVGIACEAHPVDLDETVDPGETPAAYVERLALAKARVCRDLATTPDDAIFLGADTAVVVDGEILGKPRDREDAFSMLRRLSGREHEVLTAVALVRGGREAVRVSISRVGFADVSEAAIAAYWETGEPADKAGAYGIQGRAAAFIHHVSGSYSGVVGLPLFETVEMLGEFGMDAWEQGRF
ncbi:MAG TPA: Maf family protein [Gammaproteobacteria bacterium]